MFKMSARELDAWGGVLKSVGGDANDFQSSMQSIQQGVAAMQFGDTSLIEALGKLSALGSNAVEAYDYTKKEVDIYKLADAFKQLTDAGKEQDAYLQAQAMGINRNFFMILKQGSGVMRELYGDSYKLSGVTEQNTLKAQKLQEQWGRVGQAMSGASNQIMDQLYPSLGKLADGTQMSLDKFVEWDKSMNGGLSNAIIFAGGLTTIMAAFRALGVTVATQIATVAQWGATIEGIVTSGWFSKFLGAAGLMLHSESLNKGEDEEVKKIHAEEDKREGVTRDTTGRVITKNGKPVNGYENLTPEVKQNFSSLEEKYKLPAGMLDKIWSIESGRGQNMESPAGATGHFQFMPKTAAAYGMTKSDTYDLGKSSEAAAHMMSDLLKQFKGDESKAIAAYNWGSGNVASKGMGSLPPETVKYLSKYGAQTPPQNATDEQNAANNTAPQSTAPQNLASNIIPQITSSQMKLAPETQAYLNKYNSGFMGANVAAPANQSTSNNTSSVNIQSVNVQTQATDASGIARDMKVAIENNSLINYGMVGNR